MSDPGPRMDVPNIIEKMAAHLRTKFTDAELPRIQYPAPDRLEASPSLIFFWDGTLETEIQHGAKQDWIAYVVGRLLVHHQRATPAEFGRMDRLVTPIIDAFTVGYGTQNIQDIFRGLPGHVTRVQGKRVRGSLMTEYGRDQAYATDIGFDVVFSRKAGQ